MTKKRKSAISKPGRKAPIVCSACGNPEFKRTLTETDAVVRLTYPKNRSSVKETVVAEGALDFKLTCANCGTPLIAQLDDPRRT